MRQIFFIIFVSLGGLTMAQAADWACAVDQNGDGLFTAKNETQSCDVLSGGTLCPMDRAICQTPSPVCPMDTRIPCANGVCAKTTACQVIPIKRPSGRFQIVYQCPSNGSLHGSQTACQTACTETQACATSAPVCPLTNGGPCLDTGAGHYACSATPCIDLTGKANQTLAASMDDRIYVDDGEKDAAGLCLDTVMIFSGRHQECRTAGVDTAFQTCCKDFDQLIKDSTGSISEMSLATTAISGTYQVAAAAYAAYSVSGSTAAAASAAGDAALVAFDPTTLAISIAIAIAVDYFVNNCNASDMQTGIANGSGMCYATGKYCQKKWKYSGCVQQAKTYCCFNSKLARIIHQQGRPQLTSFNNVSADNCRGFYPEEFQYLDFSQIDLSEYYQDLVHETEDNMSRRLTDKVTEFHGGLK